MVITRNTRLQPGEYSFHEAEGITVATDNITVEARGVVLRGGRGSKDFYGTGLTVAGRRGVTVRNLRLSGFDQGIRLLNCEEIALEGCDVSDCFTDPAWGWDEHGLHGGILLINTHRSAVSGCRANRVWDALNIRHSHHNTVTDNDFSHTTDTGLKLWRACDNRILRNNFSYAIRIDPGEVHARDSSGVLIESGSNRNIFFANNMTHSGDGLFIRVLNGWMSTHNVFEENDCSYANNNAVEAWADHNTYLRNKANYSSYGFWLGNSDHITMIGNEVAFNGTLHRNAPEAFGNCGVAIVGGSGSHSVLRENDIHDNCGPGIAIRHDFEQPSRHWIIEGNRIARNRDRGLYKGHGIFLQNAQWLTFAGNTFEENEGESICCAGNVSDLVLLEGEEPEAPPVRIEGGAGTLLAGMPIRLTARGAEGLRCRWDFGDGCAASGSEVAHSYREPGLYAVGVTADNGAHASLDGVNLYVLPADFLPFAAEHVDASPGVEMIRSEDGSLTARADTGREHTLMLRTRAPVVPGERDALYLHLRYVSDADTDWKRETRYPVVALGHDADNRVEYAPTQPLLEMLYASRNEERDHGRLFEIPLLAGGASFTSTAYGRGIADGATLVTVTYGGIADAVSGLTVRAIGFGTMPARLPCGADLAQGFREILAEGAETGALLDAPLHPAPGELGDATPRVRFPQGGAYGLLFDTRRYFDCVVLKFYDNPTHTTRARGESAPAGCHIEAYDGERWVPAGEAQIPDANRETIFRFPPVMAACVRAVFGPGKGSAALSALHTYHQRAMPGVIWSVPEREIPIDCFEVKLNIERNGNGASLGDLVARVFSLDGEGKLSQCLFETMVAKETVAPFAITRIPAGGLRLTEGCRYALALGQTSEAASRTEGDYYRWIAGPAQWGETFAIYTGGETRPSDYDWGTAWLRVVSGTLAAEYTHHSQHVGTRFGIVDMQCRYQTFCVPLRASLLTDGRAAGVSYALALGDDALRIVSPKGEKPEALHLYLDGELPESLTLYGGDDRVAGRLFAPVRGFNALRVYGPSEAEWRLEARGPCQICEAEWIV